jgi:hypothetical protein
MDPLTAAALAVKAIAEMVTAIVEGQPPDVKKQIWDWYVADQKAWRKMLKLDG